LKTEKIDEGLDYAKRAIEVDPSNGMACYFLGRIRLRRNELTEALAMLEKAAQLAPQAHEVQFTLSQVYVRLNRPQDAERARAEYERLQSIYQRRIGMVPFEPK
jgi:cytochrome c-type biogenesis protein CcmH/NrfG